VTEQLTVRVHDDLAHAVHPVIATLPLSLSLVRGREPADIEVISGAPGWRERLDAAGSTRGALVLDPVTEPAPAPHGLDTRSVLIGTAWRHADLVPRAAGAFRALLRPHALLECHATAPPGSDGSDLLLSQLGLLRSLGLPARSLHHILGDERGHEAIAELDDGVRVGLSSVRSFAASPMAHVELVDAAGSVSLTLPSSADGRPGTLLIEDEDGLQRVAAWFESSLRTALRTLRRLVLEADTRNELVGYAADVALLTTARRDGDGQSLAR
jgi:hypothetical protein